MFDKLKKAKNPSTDYVTLRGLASSKSSKVRAALATNTNLQPHVLEELGKDRVEAVRVALASNPNVTPKLWALLTEDESESVREALLETHPEKPVKVGHRS
jgi:hypothetical protein